MHMHRARVSPRWGQSGQATVEWMGIVLLIALLLSGGFTAAAAAGLFNGRAFGGAIFEKILCAVRDSGSCKKETALIEAYGERDADLVRNLAPNIVYEIGTKAMPIDFRNCRKPECGDGVKSMGLVNKTKKGRYATVFTHVVEKNGYKYVQYWFYFADSTSGAGPVPHPLRKPFPWYHRDDWESYQVRIGPDGTKHVRSSAHNDYRGCKSCKNKWAPFTSWHRVLGGSHAGHVPKGDTFERFTPSASLKLVPIESLSEDDKNTSFAISRPWIKKVYTNPKSWSTK